MIDVEEYQKMKKKADRLKSEVARAEGKIEALVARLQDDFDCTSLDDAKKKLKKLRLDRDKAAKQFETELEAFKAEWGDKLEEV